MVGTAIDTSDDILFFFFSSRRRHTRFDCDWSSDVCSSDLYYDPQAAAEGRGIAAPHWQRELAESDFPGRGYVPQALTHGTLECHDKDASEIGRASCRERV